MTIDLILYILAATLGISFGSFMNVLVYRMPLEMNIANPPSACPICKNELKWYHNIPVLSWIVLGAKCGFCKTKIPVIYPALELLTGILAVFLLWLGLEYNGQAYWQIGLTFFFFYLYLTMAIIDYKTHLVSDYLNLPAAVLSIFLVGTTMSDFFHNFLIGGSVALFFYVFIIKIYPKIRGIEVMGEGDIPILFGMAAVLGYYDFILGMLIASLLGILFYVFKRDNELPFIPLLALATFILFIVKSVDPISNPIFQQITVMFS